MTSALVCKPCCNKSWVYIPAYCIITVEDIKPHSHHHFRIDCLDVMFSSKLVCIVITSSEVATRKIQSVLSALHYKYSHVELFVELYYVTAYILS